LSYFKNPENIGMVGNLNRIYTLAKGEYVVELHDDDMLYPDFLSTLMAFIKKNNEKYDAVYPDRITYNMNDSVNIPKRLQPNKLQIFNIKVFDFLSGNIVPSPEHIIKKVSFLKIGGYSEDFYPADDMHFYVKFAYYFNTCKLSGYPLSVYRIFQNSSAETNTLLGFVIKGTEIQKGISELFNNRFVKFLWKRYNSVYNFKLLNSGKDIYFNEEINVNNEFHSLGFKNYKIDNLLYRVMNYYNKFSCIYRTKKLKLNSIKNHN
jgi:glycosyltransferase involved in cell wall biosynthesis